MRGHRYALIAGVLFFVIAVLAALHFLGFGENLSADVDGIPAMEDARITTFGWWSILWRATLVGLGGAGTMYGALALWRRIRRTSAD